MMMRKFRYRQLKPTCAKVYLGGTVADSVKQAGISFNQGSMRSLSSSTSSSALGSGLPITLVYM